MWYILSLGPKDWVSIVVGEQEGTFIAGGLPGSRGPLEGTDKPTPFHKQYVWDGENIKLDTSQVYCILNFTFYFSSDNVRSP